MIVNLKNITAMKLLIKLRLGSRRSKGTMIRRMLARLVSGGGSLRHQNVPFRSLQMLKLKLAMYMECNCFGGVLAEQNNLFFLYVRSYCRVVHAKGCRSQWTVSE